MSDNSFTDSGDYGLRGKLLIAMPGMGDPRFDRSVVFLCEHNEKGAMGLIVNKSAPELRFADLVEQLELGAPGQVGDVPVHFGGPVENSRGFVLHSDEYGDDDTTLRVEGGFGMTATLDVVRDIVRGVGPSEVIFALGYAGWGPGQLEDEIQHNGWLTADADRAIVFSPDNAAKWGAALKSLGIDALSLSAASGRA